MSFDGVDGMLFLLSMLFLHHGHVIGTLKGKIKRLEERIEEQRDEPEYYKY